MHFHHRVWYYALSLHYASIQSSGIILIPKATFVPNIISFLASIVELALGEKSYMHCNHSINHSITREPKLSLRNYNK